MKRSVLKLSLQEYGVWLDSMIKFAEYFRRVIEKAGKFSKALARIMPIKDEPRVCKRRILAREVHFRVLYVATVWLKR